MGRFVTKSLGGDPYGTRDDKIRQTELGWRPSETELAELRIPRSLRNFLYSGEGPKSDGFYSKMTLRAVDDCSSNF